MNYDLIQLLFLLATFLSAVGILAIIYSRNTVETPNKLFILILTLVLGYLISHGVHFIFMFNKDVTMLDISCHSFLLLIIVTLTFFTWNFPAPQKIGFAKSVLILFPSLSVLIMLWNGNLINESHAHMGKFVAHYTPLYPLFLFWYLALIILNAVWIIRKRKTESNPLIRSQLLLFVLGLIITDLTSFIFGLFLPWVLGFYFLVEMSHLAFLSGVILFTAVAIGKYNMFPAALDKVNRFSINRKMFFSSVILVPIIILVIQIPLGRWIFNIDTNFELTRYFFISLFVGIIVSLSITFVILQVISNPMNKLKAKVIDIEKGNYGIQIDYSSNDEIGGLTKAFNKMSETLKKNSVELQGKENRISLLLNAFENAAAAIAILDEKFFVIDANNQFYKFVNKKKGMVIGKLIQQLQFANDEKYFDNILSVLNRHEKFNGEFEDQDEAGDKKHLLISATRVSLDSEGFSGFIFVELDVTDRKKLEQQLVHSEKLAAIGKMAAVLAHEIKTPLTSIKMNADIVMEALTPNENFKDSLEIMKKEISRMNNLVNETLQFSKQVYLNYANSHLGELIKYVFTGLQNKLTSKNVRLINYTDDIELEIDFERIKQVLLNLVDNAIDAVEENGEIKISSRFLEDNKTIGIRICDNGAGINEPRKVFEPFYTTKKLGTGLGLAISRNIIEQHKGSLELISSRKGETIFEIQLPLKR